ncbi:hydantoinase B/oxoprolinase family protein [Desulforhopalus sp. 52FAK]
MTQWQIWIDRGGTFTDLVAKTPNGNLVTHKLLSENPEKYKDAAVQGIRDLLNISENEPIPAGIIHSVKMGTTVATNALLERKGDRTLLAITRGFGDALRIGYQSRPDLFARHIQLPEMLYETVIEINERVSAEGEVLEQLDTERARTLLQQAFDQGIRAIAIVLMHGYRYSHHEEQIAQLAEEIGYTQISTSHKVSPLIKLVSRGDTTVVDSYLSPILRRYVELVAGQLSNDNDDNPQLMFMQSNGGLTDAKLFQGKDAILSGPAGGVVGMVKTATMAGDNKLIGFDMGGTSTDIAHYNGEYERSFETMVAGIRMRAPMMHIHTVAAGGGSILNFDGARYRVGPESAGANPGPACYRRGGELTVTDCNVMLGKIQPKYFPEVFGPEANEPLDKNIVLEKFSDLATQIASSTGLPEQSPEEVAAGFLRIAVENMANAIKKISVQRGYDVTDYTLNCFGGAGGQHACLVADALGMKKVFLHPFAGVLSAYGMGLADIRAMRETQLEIPLDNQALQTIEEASSPFIHEVSQEIAAQGVESEKISIIEKCHIRYDGTDSSLLVDFDTVEAMQKNFEKAHQQRFGFIAKERGLIVEALSVEGVGHSETVEVAHNNVTEPVKSILSPVDSVDMIADGKQVNVSLFNRDSIQTGQQITGPAIIAEKTGTVIVEPGWRAEIDQFDNLIINRYLEQEKQHAIGTSADPVMLEVFNNLFMSIAEQMGATLANTSYSVNIKERLDFSCALFDQQGNLVANAPHVPVHLGSMGESIKTIIRENGSSMQPGNSYMLNAPYNGGTHLPDVTVITPVFSSDEKEILFYLGSRGHHADIGGRTPGSSPPDSTHIEDEGVLIDNFLLVEKGTLREKETRDLLASGRYPCRNIDQNMADLTAQIAANTTGSIELHKMVDNFGIDVVHAYMKHVQDNAEESVRRVVDVLQDCSFTYPMDEGRHIDVNITVDRDKREATIDFSGTSPQSAGNYNAPAGVCKAAVLYVFRTLVADNIPLNEGCMKPLQLVIPEKSMINPKYPAAVISGNTEVSQGITDALFGALGVLASSQGTMNNFVYGNATHQNYETICGGTGAGPDHPGTNAVHSHMTNTRMTDPEVVEHRFPVQVESFSIRKDSGGKGKYPGGDGVIRKIRFLEPMTATILSSHRETEPYGLRGGGPGKKGQNIVTRNDGSKQELKGNDEVFLSANDSITIKTPGGGGFGKP